MHYLPPAELAGVPHVVVDGEANADTVLVLSHWPHTTTPHELRADTSAEIVMRFLESGRQVVADVVTNDHFDEDGLLGVWAMTAPEVALRHRALVEDAARAGDFGLYRDRAAARLSFAISALADASPLPPETPYPTRCAALFRTLLPRVPELLADIDAARSLWEREDAQLSESEARIARGEIAIEEVPELDLAIVRLPERLAGARVHRFTQARSAVLHPMAVHARTERMRVLYIQGASYELQLRYETWVQYASRVLAPRPDLGPLAHELSALDDAQWTFDGVDRITPRLHRTGDSKIGPDALLAVVTRHLATAPPAWDPYMRV